MGQVEPIFLVVDHIRKPSSKVGVDEPTVLQFELEACIESDK